MLILCSVCFVGETSSLDIEATGGDSIFTVDRGDAVTTFDVSFCFLFVCFFGRASPPGIGMAFGDFSLIFDLKGTETASNASL